MPTIFKRANNPKCDDSFNGALQEFACKTVIEYPRRSAKAPVNVKQQEPYISQTWCMKRTGLDRICEIKKSLRFRMAANKRDAGNSGGKAKL
jgi:hypothetical protein